MKNVKSRLNIILAHNRLNGKIFLIISMCLFIGSCSRGVYINTSDVKAIRFLYLPQGIEKTAAIADYQDIMMDTSFIQDTIIYDRVLIDQYIGYINKLWPCKQKSNDFRTYSIVQLKDGRQPIALGFGENFGTVIGQQQMKDDRKLFEWLHMLLYTNPYKGIYIPQSDDDMIEEKQNME